MTGRSGDARAGTALALYALGIGAWFAATGVRVTHEDGFYYFQIARNVAAGLGSTFDGLHVTNGYHPLWLLLLVPVFWIWPDPEQAVRAGVIMQACFLAAGVMLLYRTSRATGLEVRGGALAGLWWVGLTFREAVSGLEFAVHAATVLGVALAYVTWFSDGSRGGVREHGGLGTLVALAILARLDNVILAAVIGLSLLSARWRPGARRREWARLAGYALPVALVCAGYALANLWLCGHAVPVSGAVKREWSQLLLAQDENYRAGGWWWAKAHQLMWPAMNLGQRFPSSLVAGTAGVALLTIWGRRAGPGQELRGWVRARLAPWSPFVLFGVVQLLGSVALLHDQPLAQGGGLSFARWYYAIQPCLAALAVATLTEGLLRAVSARPTGWRSGAVGLGWLLSCAVPLVMTLSSVRRWSEADLRGLHPKPEYDAAEWVSATLPADALIGSWNAGTLGFLSGRRVVNLEGLVNSWEYHEKGRHDLCRYWDAEGITHLVDPFFDAASPVDRPVPITVVPVFPSYAACVDRLRLLKSGPRGLRVYRIQPGDDEGP